MLLRPAGLLCAAAIVCCGLLGCATTFGDGSSPFRKGEQKEPILDDSEESDPSDWRKEPQRLRGPSKRKVGRDSWLDSMIWSSESQDIARSLDTNL